LRRGRKRKQQKELIMKVLVCGSTGCVGRAVVRALRSRDHEVVEGARGVQDGRHSMHIDYMQPCSKAEWAAKLSARRIDAVVNCVGVLMSSKRQSFERIHTQGPIELFAGAALAGVARAVQVSALGVGSDAESVGTPYLHSKLLADEALAALPLQWSVLRPSLVYGPHSQSAALFATLASLPFISLPRRGEQQVQPIHVYELAEAVTRQLEQAEALQGVHELGGAHAMSYRDMLAAYRRSLGLGEALWLRVPMPLMQLGAWAAEALPQQVFCRDTLRLLERGNVPTHNAAEALLGRAPTALAQGLTVTPPQPWFDLSAQLSPVLSWGLRSALAAMWIYTALISALLPHQSGVLQLLARCGFEGRAGVAALVFSCALNLSLGLLTLLKPTPWLYAIQSSSVIGYTITAAWFMPELTLDHCGPLLKNLPVLMAVLVLWMAKPASDSAASKRVEGTYRTYRTQGTQSAAHAPRSILRA
jgi:uncharacterized protein YbjT (DUF2867 family)